jgi:hypothetical protein
MAYQKLQAGTAIAVIPANNINIPNPSSEILRGRLATTTQAVITLTNTFTATGTTFDDGSVKVGDIIYYHGVIPEAIRITAIVSDLILTVDDGAGGGVANNIAADWELFKDTNTACVLYVGGAGDLEVNMCNNGSTVLFTSALNGYHPIQVNRVLATGTAATNIIALW